MDLTYSMVVHVFGVPVRLQPVFRGVVFNEIVDTVPEFTGFEEQKLNDEETHLSLAAFMVTQSLVLIK